MPGYVAPIFCITGFFDILGSSLAAIGLVYIDASVWMMFRGSMIIFAGEDNDNDDDDDHDDDDEFG